MKYKWLQAMNVSDKDRIVEIFEANKNKTYDVIAELVNNENISCPVIVVRGSVPHRRWTAQRLGELLRERGIIRKNTERPQPRRSGRTLTFREAAVTAAELLPGPMVEQLIMDEVKRISAGRLKKNEKAKLVTNRSKLAAIAQLTAPWRKP